MAKKVAPSKQVASKNSDSKKKSVIVAKEKKVSPKSGAKSGSESKTKAPNKPEAKKVSKSTPGTAKGSNQQAAGKSAASQKSGADGLASKSKATKALPQKTKSEKAAKKGSAVKSAPKGPAKVVGKPKIEIHFAPKNFTRHVAPGVLIDATQLKGSSQSRAVAADTANEKKLSAKEIAKIKEILIIKRETLLSEIRHQLDDTRKRNCNLASDSADRAADSYDGEISYEMAAAGSRELEKISAAIEKIANGTYGICEGCGCAIGRSRINVLPFAIMCTECRKENELSAKKADNSMWGFLDANAEDEN